MKKAIMAILLALAIVLLTPVLARRLSEWRQAAQESASVERQEPLFTQRTQSASDELEVTLYYRYGETAVLGMERHTLDLRREETIARSIVEQLVAGPDGAHGRLSGVFPRDTQVLSVTTEGSTVFVTLSENFLGRPDGAPEDWEDVAGWQTEATLRRWLAVQSLVCSLTEGGRYQRVQLYVARSDDDVPERIPLCWFDQSITDRAVVLAACSRDDQVILTPHRAMQMILYGWQERDASAVYTLLCADEDGQMLTLSAFEAKLREADVSLMTAEITGGTIDATGRAATIVIDGAIRSSESGEARIIRESVPLTLVDDNWAMRMSTFLSLVIRE